MTEDEQIQVIEEWFKSLHVTLWGQYDVVQDDSRRLAATWFLRQMQALTKFIEPQTPDAEYVPADEDDVPWYEKPEADYA